MIYSPGYGLYEYDIEDAKEYCDANWIPYIPQVKRWFVEEDEECGVGEN